MARRDLCRPFKITGYADMIHHKHPKNPTALKMAVAADPRGAVWGRHGAEFSSPAN